MKRRKLASMVFAAAMLAFAASAGAADGTIEINQAKVLAASGFPYAISASGSYRLTGNLTVSSNTDAIDVTVNHVTIDLNGFTITGPGVSSSGDGINGTNAGTFTVENGTVTGFSLGVQTGINSIVRNVHADVNGNGINGSDNTVVEGCTANNSTGTDGITCKSGCTIYGNAANGNGNDGIFCTGNGCVISGNTTNANLNYGIACGGRGCLISSNSIYNNAGGIFAKDSSTGYGLNVLANDTTTVTSGTSIKNNVCSGVVC
jgi:hypothetical protein